MNPGLTKLEILVSLTNNRLSSEPQLQSDIYYNKAFTRHTIYKTKQVSCHDAFRGLLTPSSSGDLRRHKKKTKQAQMNALHIIHPMQ